MKFYLNPNENPVSPPYHTGLPGKLVSLQSLVQNAPKTLYFKAFLFCLVCKLHTIYTLMKFFV